MPLSVQGGLSFTVDGPGGSTSGEIVGDGPVLRVRAEDAVAAWDASVGSVSAGPAGLRVIADQLAAEGLSIEVSGPDGLLATVGAGVDSSIGRLVTGSRRVKLGRPAALRPLAVAQARRSAPAARTLALGAGALALLAAVLRRLARA